MQPGADQRIDFPHGNTYENVTIEDRPGTARAGSSTSRYKTIAGLHSRFRHRWQPSPGPGGPVVPGDPACSPMASPVSFPPAVRVEAEECAATLPAPRGICTSRRSTSAPAGVFPAASPARVLFRIRRHREHHLGNPPHRAGEWDRDASASQPHAHVHSSQRHNRLARRELDRHTVKAPHSFSGSPALRSQVPAGRRRRRCRPRASRSAPQPSMGSSTRWEGTRACRSRSTRITGDDTWSTVSTGADVARGRGRSGAERSRSMWPAETSPAVCRRAFSRLTILPATPGTLRSRQTPRAHLALVAAGGKLYAMGGNTPAHRTAG